MDSVDRAILNIIQASFPINRHPYRQLGTETGITELEAWDRVVNLKKKGIIRRIGGIFNSGRLGYISTLCAAKVPSEKAPIIAGLTQEITEITHNYLRDHVYNMWFTIIALSPARLEEILTLVRKTLGSNEVYTLPAIKMFKIGVHFDLESDNTNKETMKGGEGRTFGATTKQINNSPGKENTDLNKKSVQHTYSRKDLPKYIVTEEDKALIRILQDDLPDSIDPFADIAMELNIEEEGVISGTYRLINNKVMRRLGAVLYHDKAGFTSNAMGVWIVPQQMVDEVGSKMAEFKAVSHCYERPTFPDWPYNLFTMIHGQTDKECEQIMTKISEATGIKDYEMLFSQTELKKSSMSYFVEKDKNSEG